MKKLVWIMSAEKADCWKSPDVYIQALLSLASNTDEMCSRTESKRDM